MARRVPARVRAPVRLPAQAPGRPAADSAWAARAWAPRFPNLAAITFEYHESYHKRLGISGVARELDLMHELAAQVAEARRA